MNALIAARHTWITPLIEYLQHAILPDNHEEARKIRIKAPLYALVNGELYRKGFTTP